MYVFQINIFDPKVVELSTFESGVPFVNSKDMSNCCFADLGHPLDKWSCEIKQIHLYKKTQCGQNILVSQFPLMAWRIFQK